MRVAVVGTGNIGTDLLEKLRVSRDLELVLFAGIDETSPGIARAREYGIPTSIHGAESILNLDPPVATIFEATSAAVHRSNAPHYARAGVRVIDLTPARLGPPVIPAVNIEAVGEARNISLTTCGGQATVPIVAAIKSVCDVNYAEIVSTVASLSAGPGTRANIDEFTQTTADALIQVGGATRSKAIIILNPATPPIMMRNTVYCLVSKFVPQQEMATAVHEVARRVQAYVPGYRVSAGPEFEIVDSELMRVTTYLEVEGAGHFLPAYAGNLDIMTAAAIAVGEHIAMSGESAR